MSDETTDADTVAELFEMALSSGDEIQLVNCVVEHQRIILAALRAVKAETCIKFETVHCYIWRT